MDADIHSGSILALLPINGLFFAVIMYNMEHVSRKWTQFWCLKFLMGFFFLFSLKSSFQIVDFFYRVVCVVTGLTWPFLYCYFASFTTLWFELVRTPLGSAKAYRFDGGSLSTVWTICWTQFNPLYFGIFWQRDANGLCFLCF